VRDDLLLGESDFSEERGTRFQRRAPSGSVTDDARKKANQLSDDKLSVISNYVSDFCYKPT
jgi:hypothetical protein